MMMNYPANYPIGAIRSTGGRTADMRASLPTVRDERIGPDGYATSADPMADLPVMRAGSFGLDCDRWAVVDRIDDDGVPVVRTDAAEATETVRWTDDDGIERSHKVPMALSGPGCPTPAKRAAWSERDLADLTYRRQASATILAAALQAAESGGETADLLRAIERADKVRWTPGTYVHVAAGRPGQSGPSVDTDLICSVRTYIGTARGAYRSAKSSPVLVTVDGRPVRIETATGTTPMRRTFATAQSDGTRWVTAPGADGTLTRVARADGARTRAKVGAAKGTKGTKVATKRLSEAERRSDAMATVRARLGIA